MATDKTPTLQILKQYITEPDSVMLTEAQRETCDRLTETYKLLKHDVYPKTVVRKLIKLYGVKERTAYNLVWQAQKLFAPQSGYDIDFLRELIIEDALKQLQAAQTVGNHKAWEAARNTLLKIYIVDKTDGERIDPELLGNNTYMFVIPGTTDSINMMELDKLSKTSQTDLVMKLFAKDVDDADVVRILNEKQPEDEQNADD
jgi:hypothetical protein